MKRHTLDSRLDEYAKHLNALMKKDKLEDSYTVFSDKNIFSGPSLHFHLRAISLRNLAIAKDKNIDAFLEMTYAALVSWGMHKMGSRGPKMVGFNEFRNSTKNIWQDIKSIQKYSYQNMTDEAWKTLENIYKNLKIMGKIKVGEDLRQIETYIVGHSKVLSHILPDIVAPIDREYTLKFLHGNKNINVGNEMQWPTFRAITQNFYHALANKQEFKDFYEKMKNNSEWNTSLLKFADNIVIGAVKATK